MLNDKESLWEYICKLAGSVPPSLYAISAFIALIASVVFFKKIEKTKALKFFVYLSTVEYIVILYSSTIFFREIHRFRKYNLRPFWSYDNFCYHANEILMNVVVFIPLGAFLGVIYKTNTSIKVALSGMLISFVIELLQITFKKGFAEFDDVMHNTLGCMLGYIMYLLIDKFIGVDSRNGR